MATTFLSHVQTGDHASRPAATTVAVGTLYACTDHFIIYQSDGATWSNWHDGASAVGAHTHPQSDITNLVTDLAAKAPLASPALTGTPTAPTAAGGTNTTQLATTAFVQSAVTLGMLESFVIACSDETTALTSGAAKVTFRMPYAFTVTAVKGSLTTTSSSGNVVVDINEGGASILTNPITIEAGDTTSLDAGTQPSLSDTSLAADAVITIDVDDEGTGAAGLKVTIIGRPT